MRRRLVWQIYVPLMVVVLGVLIAISAYTTHTLREFYIAQARVDLQDKARLVEELLAKPLQRVETMGAVDAAADIDEQIKRLGREVDARITIILTDGLVVADSAEEPQRMDNHAQRPEVLRALAGQIGSSLRFSHTVQRNMLYVAIPLLRAHAVSSVVRTSIPLTSIETTLGKLYRRIALAGLLVALCAALVALFVSRRISRPLEELGRGAALFAHGDLQHRLSLSGSREIAGVAEGMNEMAAELDRRMHSVEDKRTEQEAVLSSMVEGVIAIDTEGRLITLNAAAALLLDIDPHASLGGTIEETVRNPELQRFVNAALEAKQPIQEELTFHTRDAQIWQAHGACIREAGGGCLGAVVVLNDVTEMRRLETIRRDFVANVSHELKTPITAVTGFLETLLDGALDDPQTARRFVEIAARQADRLNAIIEDLLSLSRLEQTAAPDSLERGPVALATLLANTLEACGTKAAAKNITLELHCNSDVQATVNAPLLEQAAVNLIDNAIKYSPNGSRVTISGRATDGHIEVEVRDQGAGIEQRHLPRLFERFYRVDKARSRDMGGTGLGLAIVKHIAQAHGGSVDVSSRPGKGSIFTIRI